MRDHLDIRRKRLRYRSWHRGTKELDLLLGSFAERHLESMDSGLLDAYEAFLGESDPDLESWLAGRETPPRDLDDRLRALIVAYEYKPVRP